MSTVFSYLRVSTDEQQIKNQRMEIESYCKNHNLTIDETIEIKISSKKDLKRRHIDELLSRLKKGDTLIVSELSRLGRSIRELSTIVEKLVDKKVTFIAIKQDMKFNGKLNVTQKVMITMFSLFSELERDLISERTKNGLARVKAEGKVLGNPNLQRDNTVRFENAKRFAEEKRTIIDALIDKGLTQRGIIEELNTQGITARRGGQWTLSQLQRVMKKLNLKTTGAKS